jgi:hypothetical protein
VTSSRRETRCIAATSLYFQSIDSAVVINDAAGLFAFQNSNPGRSFQCLDFARNRLALH